MSMKQIGLEIRDNVVKYQQKNAIYYKEAVENKWVGISWNELGKQTKNLSKIVVEFWN